MHWLPLELGSLAEGLPRLILVGVERNPLLGYGLIAMAMLLENLIPPIFIFLNGYQKIYCVVLWRFPFE